MEYSECRSIAVAMAALILSEKDGAFGMGI